MAISKEKLVFKLNKRSLLLVISKLYIEYRLFIMKELDELQII